MDPFIINVRRISGPHYDRCSLHNWSTPIWKMDIVHRTASHPSRVLSFIFHKEIETGYGEFYVHNTRKVKCNLLLYSFYNFKSNVSFPMCIIEYTNLVKIKDVRKVFCWTPRDFLPSTNFKLKTIEYKSGKNIFFHLKIKQFWCMWVLAFSKPVFVYKHLPLTINHYFTK